MSNGSDIKLKFTLVLIDTPGMNSTDTSIDGFNAHAEIALEAISSESKPMIILCAVATQAQDEKIGEFMREIIIQSKKDKGGFNDRFLFVMFQIIQKMTIILKQNQT